MHFTGGTLPNYSNALIAFASFTSHGQLDAGLFLPFSVPLLLSQGWLQWDEAAPRYLMPGSVLSSA